MKLKIKNFKELVGKEISLPQAIVSGANGAGKTSILEAFYFVVDGKRSDGSAVGGEIYSQYAKSRGDLIVEVELEMNDKTKFLRRCEGSEKREKGSIISELVRNINTTLFIEKDGKTDIVTLREWNDAISVYFPENWRYYTNPNYLEAQKQSDVKDFVFNLLGLQEFDTKNKDIARSKVAEKNAEIAKLELLIQEYQKNQKPAKVEDLTGGFDAQISVLRSKINIPTLSTLDVQFNSQIEKKIAEIRQTEPVLKSLKDEEFVPSLVLKETLQLNNISELESEIDEIKNSEYDNIDDLRTLDFAEKNNKEKSEIEAKIANYDNIKAGLKCTVCPICSDLFCEKRIVEIESLEELQQINESLEIVDIENLKLTFEAAKVEFEEQKNNQIAGLEAELKKLEAANEKIKESNAKIKAENDRATLDYNSKVDEINAKNEQIRIDNEKIKFENGKNLAEFEAEKSAKIAELRARIKYPAKVDNSEFEFQILELEKQKEDNRQLFLNFTKLQAICDNAQSEITRLTAEKTALQEKRADFEQEMIVEKNKEFEFYKNVENRINSQLSEFGVKFKLYRKLISNDDFKADFSIILNDRDFNSNGEAFIQKVALCNFFQSQKGVVLPIFCDETAILDDSNLQNLINIFEENKNIVILEKTTKALNILNF